MSETHLRDSDVARLSLLLQTINTNQNQQRHSSPAFFVNLIQLQNLQGKCLGVNHINLLEFFHLLRFIRGKYYYFIILW